MATRVWDFLARKFVASGHFNPVVDDSSASEGGSSPATNDPAPELVYHDAAKAHLDFQARANEILDVRIAQSFQIGTIVLTITVGLLGLTRSGAHIPSGAKWALGLALACYVAGAFFAFRASLYRTFNYRPDIPTLHNYLDEFSGTGLRSWVALEYQDSIVKNEAMLAKMGRLVGAGTFSLYLEGGALGVAALVTLFS